MKLKQLFADEDAVSPVIGVILMVAITVILAAVIGTFVLGLGDQVDNSAPQTNFQFEYTTTDTSGSDEMSITHNGGSNVQAGDVSVNIDGSTVWDSDNGYQGNVDAGGGATWSSTITTGDRIDIDETGSNQYDPEDEVRVIWTNPSGGSSSTIGSSTVPN